MSHYAGGFLITQLFFSTFLRDLVWRSYRLAWNLAPWGTVKYMKSINNFSGLRIYSFKVALKIPHYFRHCLINAHHVCCEDIGLKICIIFSQSDDLDLHSRSQLYLKLTKVLLVGLLYKKYLRQAMAFTFGTTVCLCIA